MKSPCEPVESPTRHHVNAALSGIGHETIQLGTGLDGTADALVYIFPSDVPVAGDCVLAQFAELHTDILTVIQRRNSGVQRNPQGMGFLR